MTRTRLDTPAFADQSVDSRNIADGTIQAQDVAPGVVSADKLSDTLDLSSKTVTLPNASVANAKLANSSISINGTSISLGASTSIITFLDWQAVTVADGSTTLTAEAGKGYFLDTNTGVIEVFLPTSPSRGDTIGLVDYSGTFAPNKCIINTGGVSIDSSITDGSTAGNEYQVTTNNAIVELVYVDSAKGWQVILNQAAGTTPSSVLSNGVYDSDPTFTSATGGTVTTSGDFKIHTFTGDGTFAVSTLGNSPTVPAGGPSNVDYLVVAGGGAGGRGIQGGAPRGGGGGAGGYRTTFPSPGCNAGAFPITLTSYPITVGAGGTEGGAQPNPANNGSNSIFSTITSTGGGGGGSGGPAPCNSAHGRPGGSGGGGAGGAYARNAGCGNTPPVSPSQGNNGGTGENVSAGSGAGGGGGGAGATGSNAPSSTGGNGGNGSPNEITGSNVTYAGGGGGAGEGPTSSPGVQGGTGGSGGGGNGGPSSPGDTPGLGVDGTANTGGGAGGGGHKCNGLAGAGGKGIVVIRYKFQ